MDFNKKLFESKYVPEKERVPVDTLILVGNGFDSWQRLPTGYSYFETYYEGHVDEVLERLHIKKHILKDKDGNPVPDRDGNMITYNDAELFYGDPEKFRDPEFPKRLPHEFWMDFETSLDKIDDQGILYHFGKTSEDLKKIRQCADHAKQILTEIFCDWILSFRVEERPSEYEFNNCLFVNFNYTDTLLKRFGVEERQEFHIHGSALDRESIVFGHASHPELPYAGMPGGPNHPRYEGLYYIEEFLYHSDKHIEDRYLYVKIFLAMHGVRMEDIKEIYVLGLGFGDADLGYIRNVYHDTEGLERDREADLREYEKRYLDSMDYETQKVLNIEYAASHRERIMRKDPISYPEYERLDQMMFESLGDPYYHVGREQQIRLQAAAVRRRFWEEQEIRNRKIKREYLRLLSRLSGGKRILPEDDPLERNGNASGARWHISYYSDKDKERITHVMKELGCENFELYPTIDACIQKWKK